MGQVAEEIARLRTKSTACCKVGQRLAEIDDTGGDNDLDTGDIDLLHEIAGDAAVPLNAVSRIFHRIGYPVARSSVTYHRANCLKLPTK